MGKKKKMVLLTGLGMAVISILWLAPVYYMIINSLKSFQEVTLDTAAFPTSLYLENFKTLWSQANYPRLLINSLIVTVLSLVGIIFLGSMAGYKIARSKTRWSFILLIYFVMTMIIPFQSIMIPLIRLLLMLNLMDNIYGLVLVYIAQLSPMAIFFYQAAVKSISPSMEESAKIDGAGPFRTFFQIIFPLLSPITATIIILHTLWIWNDFLLPLVTLQSRSNHTLSLGTYALFVGQYGNRMNLGMAAVFMATLPMLLVYLVAQRYIVKGITSGATKG